MRTLSATLSRPGNNGTPASLSADCRRAYRQFCAADGRSSLPSAAPIPRPMAPPRLTLLRCGVCKREKAHVVERVNGVLTFTCKHCGTAVAAAQASR